MQNRWLWLVAGGVVLGGCDKKTPPAEATPAEAGAQNAAPAFVAHHSCDQRDTRGVCLDYAQAGDASLHKTLCDSFKGHYAEAPCTAADRMGSCQVEVDEVKRYYGKTSSVDWVYTAETSKQDCESQLIRGKFSAN